MRVLFLQQQPCIRALKYAAALRDRHPWIRLGFAYRGQTLGEWYGAGDELFERWWKLGDGTEADLRAAVGEFRPDLIHSHNLPDALTVAAIELFGERLPVVHDVHDLQSLRRTEYEDGFPEPEDPSELEKRAIEDADALVTVSEELLAEIRSRHRAPGPALTFANYALGRDLPKTLPERNGTPGRPRFVYQGTLSTNGGHYDLRQLFLEIVAGGASLDVYPARSVDAYESLANDGVLRVHATRPPARLLEALPAYDFGWAGFNDSLNAAHLDTALPNKLFEYLGCGLPVITLGHRAVRRFVETEGVGLSLPEVNGVAEQLAEIDGAGLRRRVAEIRGRFTAEAHIGRLVELYESLVR